MKRLTRDAALMAMLLCGLAACSDMHDQPSFKPQEAPRLAAPAAAVPVDGRVPVGWGDQPENPVAATDASLRRGAELYRINCALCHGTKETYLGKIGKKLTPPPPSLHDPRIRNLGDSGIFIRISLGFGRMPAFQYELPAEDRWHIVNYVQTF